MSLPRSSIDRPIAVGMFFLAVLLVGTISLRRLPIDLLPDVAYPQLVIHTAEPGSSPSEIERTLTEPIERAVASVPGVQRVESISRDGVSLVTVRFGWGADMDFAALNIRERLDNVRALLPVVASAPVVLRTDPRSEPILSISVGGAFDQRAMKELSEQVFKRRLEQLEGVAHAAVIGGVEREIQVDLDPRLLESYGLTIDQIAEALGSSNVAGQGGTVRRGRYRYSLRTLGEFRTPEEIGAVALRLRPQPGRAAGPGAGGEATILLRDLATITDGERERESISRFSRGAEGGEAVGLLIFKSSGENTVRVTDRVREALDELRAEYPDIRLEIAMEQAGFISDAISNVLDALLFGGLLAFLVLFLFLRDSRYPVAIAVAIPISVVGSFALLDAGGVSLNIMTLGGLALGVGMLVDNSIVVLENIFRHRQLGESTRTAAARGAEEVQGAITASTLTTISVFAPIVYTRGMAGELFAPLALAVTFSLLVSLLVALTLLPVLASREGVRRGGHRQAATDGLAAAGEQAAAGERAPGAVPGSSADIPKTADAALRRTLDRYLIPVRTGLGRILLRPFSSVLERFDRLFLHFADAYLRWLPQALARPGSVVCVACLLVVASIALAALLPRAVLPEVEQGGFRIRVELERGTTLEETAALAIRLEELLGADPEVAAIFTRIGRADANAEVNVEDAGLHTASIEVELAPGAVSAHVMGRFRAALASEIHSMALLAGDAITMSAGGATALGRLLGSSEADLAVRIRSDDLEEALAYASAVEQRLAAEPSLTNVRLGTELGHPEIRIEIDRERTASYGLDPRRVALAIDRGMRGVEATQFADFDRRVPVLVRLPDAARSSLQTLDDLRVEGVPVRELISLIPGLGPSEVRRLDQGRLVPVFADVAAGGLGSALHAAEVAVREVPPPPGVRVEIGGENEEMRRSFRDLGFAFGLALLLVYMILAAQFESLIHPFTIMLSVPLALSGAVGALAITGAGLNTMSLIGIVILVGIVVNNAILLVDLINRLRREGMALRRAMLEAGRARLRPILMTSITTILGLLPMAFGIGSGADLRAPLAIAVIGGLTTATLLTLVVIPVVYELIEKGRARIVGESTDAPPASVPSHEWVPVREIAPLPGP